MSVKEVYVISKCIPCSLFLGFWCETGSFCNRVSELNTDMLVGFSKPDATVKAGLNVSPPPKVQANVCADDKGGDFG